MKKFYKALSDYSKWNNLDGAAKLLLEVVENGDWKIDYYFASDAGSGVNFNKKAWNFLLSGGETLDEQLAFGKEKVIKMLKGKNNEVTFSKCDNEWQSDCIIVINRYLGLYLKFALNNKWIPVIDIHISDWN